MHLDGVLDLGSVPQVRQHLEHALNDGTRIFVLDLTGVRLIDSTALGMIVWLCKELSGDGGRVYVAGAQPLVLNVLQVTSVDSLVHITDSVAEAEAHISA
ncbi:hypothetical protein GCM10009681_08950 [Luedemannella helvata]|uniref:Anti-sigma factor antagonist n=1 Tax=Luedemannella helvata TaxID=349315 RepID=A0ABP4VZG7_9ACTN